MNFFSGSLLSQQMVWLFIIGASLKTQSPQLFSGKYPETLSPMILWILHCFHQSWTVVLCLILTQFLPSFFTLKDPLYFKLDLSINSGLPFLLPDAAKLWELMASLTVVSNELCFALSLGCVTNTSLGSQLETDLHYWDLCSDWNVLISVNNIVPNKNARG